MNTPPNPKPDDLPIKPEMKIIQLEQDNALLKAQNSELATKLNSLRAQLEKRDLVIEEFRKRFKSDADWEGFLKQAKETEQFFKDRTRLPSYDR